MKPLILRGPRITLRPMKLSDAEFFVSWLGRPEIVRYLHWQSKISLAQERKWISASIKDKNDIFWTLVNEDGILLGNTTLRLNKKAKKAEFGIVIGNKTQWGKGYAGECITLLKQYLFGKLKFNRLELKVSVHNERGIKAYTKAGFSREGILRQDDWNAVDKRFEDHVIMSILRKEWLKKK